MRLTPPAAAIRREGWATTPTADLEGRDEEVEPALHELWHLLDATRGYPGLPERFARLQIVADAVDFLKDRTDPHAPR